jgi:hypothetical protein
VDHPVHLPRVRTAVRAPAWLRAPASDCSSGLCRSCSAKSKASVVDRRHGSTPAGYGVSAVAAPAASIPGERAARRVGSISGLGVTWHLHRCVAIRRIITAIFRASRKAALAATSLPPHYGDRIASGAPGRGAAAIPRQAGLPSVHLLRQPGRPLPVLPGLTRLPRLVARGYPAAVPASVQD